MRKAVTFAIQVIVTTIIWTACMYLWYLIAHEVKGFDWSLLLQGFVFSIIFVPFSNWWDKKKARKIE